MSAPRTVVITGASAGIGEALALELAARGDRVVLAARRRPELERVAAEAERRGAPSAVVVPADVTRREDVNRLRDTALDVLGAVDVWVNNAGRGVVRPVLELTDAEFDAVMDVNVRSALYGMQAIAPYFVERNAGHLINISSFLGRVPLVTFRSAYNAAKAALNALTANVRVDLRARAPGVHVSLVMPGIVTTEFARNALNAPANSPPFRTPARNETMKPQAPDEVARAIAELIDHPVPELYTNPASAELARRYYADVGAFEAAAAAR